MLRILISVLILLIHLRMFAQDGGGLPPRADVDIAGLVEEVAEPLNGAKWPSKRYSLREVRSGAGSQAEGFLRIDETPGGKEYVLAELDGPGVLVHWHVSEPRGHLRLYIDDALRPALDLESRLAFTGQLGLVAEPFASARDGLTLRFPFPFQKKIRVVTTQGGFSYELGFRIYDPRTTVDSFVDMKSGVIGHFLAQGAISRLKGPATQAEFSATRTSGVERFGPEIQAPVWEGPGEKVVFEASFPKGGVIEHIAMDVLEQSLGEDVLDNLRLRIEMDGQLCVDVALSRFFGGGTTWRPWTSFLFGHEGGIQKARRVSFLMPFRKSAVIRVLSEEAGPVKGPVFLVRARELPWNDDFLYFHAREVGTVKSIVPPEFTPIFRGKGRVLGSTISVSKHQSVPIEDFQLDGNRVRVSPPAAAWNVGDSSTMGAASWPFTYRCDEVVSGESRTVVTSWHGLFGGLFERQFDWFSLASHQRVVFFYGRESTTRE